MEYHTCWKLRVQGAVAEVAAEDATEDCDGVHMEVFDGCVSDEAVHALVDDAVAASTPGCGGMLVGKAVLF